MNAASEAPLSELDLDLQIALAEDDNLLTGLPSVEQIECWVTACLPDDCRAMQLTVRVVDIDEMTALNEHYRHKKGPTNVLSFPFEAPAGVDLPLLGDVVICAAVVAREAAEQGKPLEAHWAHMVVHGALHLLGYDHITDTEAAVMESLEIGILARLGYTNPYDETEYA